MDEDLIASGADDDADADAGPGRLPGADRGRSRRVLLTAGIVAAGLIAGGAVAAALASGGHRDGQPAHAIRSPTTAGLTFIPGGSPPPGERIISGPVPRPSGPTAAQIAHGTWHNVPAAPIDVCPGATAAWDGHELLVVSEQTSDCGRSGSSPGASVGTMAAAAYDTHAARWRMLSSPPRALAAPIASVWGDGQLYVVSWTTGDAVVWNSHADGWGALPSLPPSPGPAPSLVWDGARLVAVGVGAAGDRVYALDGERWAALQPLPHADGEDVATVGAGMADGAVFAVETTETVEPVGSGEVDENPDVRLLRLDGLRWTRLPHPADLPFEATVIDGYGGRVFVAGSLCPPNAPCPLAGPQMMLFEPGSSIASGLGQSPLRFAQVDVALAGRAVLSYNPASVETGPRVRPGDTAAYDIAHGRWLRGPSSVPVDDVAATAWTPDGFLVLGRPVEKCGCSLGGLILRPASK